MSIYVTSRGMKKSVLVAILLFFTVGVVNVSAQSFLKNLGRSIEKAVNEEVGKKVDKELDNVKDALKGSGKDKGSKEKVNPTDVPIKTMDTWLLVVKDGRPHYKFIGSSAERKVNFYLDNIEYEHPGGVEPFMFTTAVFKAKDGYYFDKKLKLNQEILEAENTTGFKLVDAKTVKVYLTAFTGDMGYNVRITPAMKRYKESISKLNLTPVATAKMNTPLFDYWSKRGRWGDDIVDRFIANNMRAKYEYPTTEEYFDSDGAMVKDAKKTEYPSNYTILSVNILDDDLSDDIPGLVGEWCLIDNKKFIPKACLKDIKLGSAYSDGAPAKLVKSPFEFAGGSGTFEDPYLIETAEQLNAVRQGPAYHYKLIADIDLSKWGNWVPIGASESYGFMAGGRDKSEKGTSSFQGSFDGNGHVISGMQIVIKEETPYLTEGVNFRAYGLFGNLATNYAKYKIKNLGVVNFNIDVSYTNLEKEVNLYAAAICGGMNSGTDIYNCYSKGGKIRITLIGNEKYAKKDQFGQRINQSPYVHVHAGGICADGGGSFYVNPKRGTLEFIHIENCFNASDIELEIKNLDYIAYGGGIMGAMAETHIHNCYNSGNITLPLELENIIPLPTEAYAAGITSYASTRDIGGLRHYNTEQTSFIQNCYNSGQIIGRGAAGLLYLSLRDIHIENCYNTGTIVGNEFDQANSGSSINPTVGKACEIVKYGTEYIRNTTADGNAVTGPKWKASAVLGRKVLAAIPEDTHPSKQYEVDPVKVGGFTDVNTVAWYAKAVQWALNKGIISDNSHKFNPDKNCTKADLYTFLWNAAGSPQSSGSNSFSDVKSTDSYYYASIWAKEKGLVSGTTFNPNAQVTRGELVVSLWKYLGSPEGMQANQYLDIESHQSDFGRAVAWSHINSVMGGTDMHKFSPKKKCTRAVVINIMHRALK